MSKREPSVEDLGYHDSTRRAARIASLLGETVLAVRLGMELKRTGGHPPANAEDTRRLMADPSQWGDPASPVEEAITIYTNSRLIGSGPSAGKIAAHGLSEVEELLAAASNDPAAFDHPEGWELRRLMHDIRERTRHTVFAALCAWERQLTYANVNERIFERFRSRVDSMLAHGAPAVLDQFSAVYRRLREATRDPVLPVSEDLAQAVTSCRRILKTVADHLAALGGIYDRFSALDKLANKGVHAELGVPEAELCAIHTYLVAGELLALGESAAKEPGVEESP